MKRFINDNFEYLLTILFFLLIVVAIVLLNSCGANDAPQEESISSTTSVITTDIATHITTANVEQATQNTVAQPMTEIVTEETTTNPQIKYYNVPLDEQFQRYVFRICEERNVSPALIFAIMERESNFNANAIGDSGNSLGIMQIQPKWHQWRADKLGCLDWMNPYDNATVGIDIVAGLFEKYGDDVYMVLMAYNGGSSYAQRMANKGVVSDYAIKVNARAEELDREIEVR